MRRFSALTFAFCLLFTLVSATDARADLTGFIGATPTGTTRPLEGFGIGTGLIIVAFEFEYASTQESLNTPSGAPAPALHTYMGNGLIQTPFPIAGMQFYATAGGGVYHETLSTDPGGNLTSVGTNVGGGAKISLLGPLRLRLDYRVFHLQGAARQPTVQRFYAGINLKF
ncbi:MAG: hypothetical protein ACRD1V_17275 [Vicinamibacterales bacterium]